MTGAIATLLFGSGTGGGSGGGGGSGSVTLNNASIDSNGSGSPSAAWRIDSDGSVYYGVDGVFTAQNVWTSDAVANYEVRATKTAGSNPTGSSLATWLSCSSDRDWTVTDTTANGAPVYSYLTIEVRDAATLEVKASCDVQIIAEKV